MLYQNCVQLLCAIHHQQIVPLMSWPDPNTIHMQIYKHDVVHRREPVIVRCSDLGAMFRLNSPQSIIQLRS